MGESQEVEHPDPAVAFWGSGPRLAAVATSLTYPLVVDHFALIKTKTIALREDDEDGGERSAKREGFEHLLSALRGGNDWAKFSAPYRCSELSPSYDDLQPIARALTSANSERMLWASDWPHTQRHAYREEEDTSEVEEIQIVDNDA